MTLTVEACAGPHRLQARKTRRKKTERIIPGLLLGRIDGKSPVEYITNDAERNPVRRVARALLLDPVDTFARVREAWQREHPN
jgi:hypothetical protein